MLHCYMSIMISKSFQCISSAHGQLRPAKALPSITPAHSVELAAQGHGGPMEADAANQVSTCVHEEHGVTWMLDAAGECS